MHRRGYADSRARIAARGRPQNTSRFSATSASAMAAVPSARRRKSKSTLNLKSRAPPSIRSCHTPQGRKNGKQQGDDEADISIGEITSSEDEETAATVSAPPSTTARTSAASSSSTTRVPIAARHSVRPAARAPMADVIPREATNVNTLDTSNIDEHENDSSEDEQHPMPPHRLAESTARVHTKPTPPKTKAKVPNYHQHRRHIERFKHNRSRIGDNNNNKNNKNNNNNNNNNDNINNDIKKNNYNDGCDSEVDDVNFEPATIRSTMPESLSHQVESLASVRLDDDWEPATLRSMAPSSLEVDPNATIGSTLDSAYDYVAPVVAKVEINFPTATLGPDQSQCLDDIFDISIFGIANKYNECDHSIGEKITECNNGNEHENCCNENDNDNDSDKNNNDDGDEKSMTSYTDRQQRKTEKEYDGYSHKNDTRNHSNAVENNEDEESIANHGQQHHRNTHENKSNNNNNSNKNNANNNNNKNNSQNSNNNNNSDNNDNNNDDANNDGVSQHSQTLMPGRLASFQSQPLDLMFQDSVFEKEDAQNDNDNDNAKSNEKRSSGTVKENLRGLKGNVKSSVQTKAKVTQGLFCATLGDMQSQAIDSIFAESQPKAKHSSDDCTPVAVSGGVSVAAIVTNVHGSADDVVTDAEDDSAHDDQEQEDNDKRKENSKDNVDADFAPSAFYRSHTQSTLGEFQSQALDAIFERDDSVVSTHSKIAKVCDDEAVDHCSNTSVSSKPAVSMHSGTVSTSLSTASTGEEERAPETCTHRQSFAMSQMVMTSGTQQSQALDDIFVSDRTSSSYTQKQNAQSNTSGSQECSDGGSCEIKRDQCVTNIEAVNLEPVGQASSSAPALSAERENCDELPDTQQKPTCVDNVAKVVERESIGSLSEAQQEHATDIVATGNVMKQSKASDTDTNMPKMSSERVNSKVRNNAADSASCPSTQTSSVVPSVGCSMTIEESQDMLAEEFLPTQLSEPRHVTITHNHTEKAMESQDLIAQQFAPTQQDDEDDDHDGVEPTQQDDDECNSGDDREKQSRDPQLTSPQVDNVCQTGALQSSEVVESGPQNDVNAHTLESTRTTAMKNRKSIPTRTPIAAGWSRAGTANVDRRDDGITCVPGTQSLSQFTRGLRSIGRDGHTSSGDGNGSIGGGSTGGGSGESNSSRSIEATQHRRASLVILEGKTYNNEESPSATAADLPPSAKKRKTHNTNVCKNNNEEKGAKVGSREVESNVVPGTQAASSYSSATLSQSSHSNIAPGTEQWTDGASQTSVCERCRTFLGSGNVSSIDCASGCRNGSIGGMSSSQSSNAALSVVDIVCGTEVANQVTPTLKKQAPLAKSISFDVVSDSQSGSQLSHAAMSMSDIVCATEAAEQVSPSLNRQTTHAVTVDGQSTSESGSASQSNHAAVAMPMSDNNVCGTEVSEQVSPSLNRKATHTKTITGQSMGESGSLSQSNHAVAAISMSDNIVCGTEVAEQVSPIQNRPAPHATIDRSQTMRESASLSPLSCAARDIVCGTEKAGQVSPIVNRPTLHRSTAMNEDASLRQSRTEGADQVSPTMGKRASNTMTITVESMNSSRSGGGGGSEVGVTALRRALTNGSDRKRIDEGDKCTDDDEEENGVDGIMKNASRNDSGVVSSIDDSNEQETKTQFMGNRGEDGAREKEDRYCAMVNGNCKNVNYDKGNSNICKSKNNDNDSNSNNTAKDEETEDTAQSVPATPIRVSSFGSQGGSRKTERKRQLQRQKKRLISPTTDANGWISTREPEQPDVVPPTSTQKRKKDFFSGGKEKNLNSNRHSSQMSQASVSASTSAAVSFTTPIANKKKTKKRRASSVKSHRHNATSDDSEEEDIVTATPAAESKKKRATTSRRRTTVRKSSAAAGSKDDDSDSDFVADTPTIPTAASKTKTKKKSSQRSLCASVGVSDPITVTRSDGSIARKSGDTKHGCDATESAKSGPENEEEGREYGSVAHVSISTTDFHKEDNIAPTTTPVTSKVKRKTSSVKRHRHRAAEDSEDGHERDGASGSHRKDKREQISTLTRLKAKRVRAMDPEVARRLEQQAIDESQDEWEEEALASMGPFESESNNDDSDYTPGAGTKSKSRKRTMSGRKRNSSISRHTRSSRFPLPTSAKSSPSSTAAAAYDTPQRIPQETRKTPRSQSIKKKQKVTDDPAQRKMNDFFASANH